MKPLRREISEILGVLIPEGGWDTVFKELGTAGKISPKVQTQILLVILKRLEADEAK